MRTLFVSAIYKRTTDNGLIVMTIHTVVDVENPSPISILCRSGVGELRVHERGSLAPRVRKIATRWLSVNVQGVLKSVVAQDPRLLYFTPA